MGRACQHHVSSYSADKPGCWQFCQAGGQNLCAHLVPLFHPVGSACLWLRCVRCSRASLLMPRCSAGLGWMKRFGEKGSMSRHVHLPVAMSSARALPVAGP